MPRVRLARGGEVRLPCGAAPVEVDGRARPLAARGRPRRVRRRAAAARLRLCRRPGFALPAGRATLDGLRPAPRARRRRAAALARARRRSPRPRGAGGSSTPGGPGTRAATACGSTATRPVVARPRPELRRGLARALRRARPRRAAPDAGLRERLADPRVVPRRALRLRPAARRDDRLRRLRARLPRACSCSCSCSAAGASRAAAPPPAPLPAAPDAPRRARPAPRRRSSRSSRPPCSGSASACAPASCSARCSACALWRGVADRVLVISAGGACWRSACRSSYVLVALLVESRQPGRLRQRLRDRPDRRPLAGARGADRARPRALADARRAPAPRRPRATSGRARPPSRGH